MKLQLSRADLANGDIAAGKLLINSTIEELKAFVLDLENFSMQVTDGTTACDPRDLINAILSP
jgi:hypothetical protein